MPAACRAITADFGQPPDLAPIGVLTAFLASTADHLVRISATGPPEPIARKTGKKAPVFDSIHDQWLHALLSADGMMAGSEADFAPFALQVREWHRPVSLPTASAFRLCFRLEEPELGDDEKRTTRSRKPDLRHDQWTVRYLLQAMDDPSLLVPAEQVWTAKGRKASVIERGSFNAREYLLSALGQASGICPHIEASLRTAAPDAYDRNARRAHR